MKGSFSATYVETGVCSFPAHTKQAVYACMVPRQTPTKILLFRSSETYLWLDTCSFYEGFRQSIASAPDLKLHDDEGFDHPIQNLHPLSHMTDITNGVNDTQQVAIQDSDNIWSRNSRDALTLFGLDFAYLEEDVDISFFPPSSPRAAQAPRSSAQLETNASSGLTANSVKSKQRRNVLLNAAWKRVLEQAGATDEYSKYRLRKERNGEYTMLSMLNGEEVPLKDKVVSSVIFDKKMGPERLNQLVLRLTTLISCLEARYRRHHAIEAGRSKRARNERKGEFRQELTTVINICCSGRELCSRIDYDIWDDQLFIFESRWLEWHSKDEGR